MKIREFLIEDLDCIVTVAISPTRKEVFSYMDEYIENSLECDYFDPYDESFAILYADGSTDHIGEDYDGHHIRKTGIVSMVYSNPYDYIVFGPFEINEYGVVTPDSVETISNTNIVEVFR